MNGERSGAYRGVRRCRQPGGEAMRGEFVDRRRGVRSAATELLLRALGCRCLERTAGTVAVCWPGPPIAIAVGRRTCGAGLSTRQKVLLQFHEVSQKCPDRTPAFLSRSRGLS
jgi:hypothetical protein